MRGRYGWDPDPELLRSATDFICEVIAFSEPLDSLCAGPEPSLLPQEYGDAAFAEAAGAAEWDSERDYEEEDELDQGG